MDSGSRESQQEVLFCPKPIHTLNQRHEERVREREKERSPVLTIHTLMQRHEERGGKREREKDREGERFNTP